MGRWVELWNLALAGFAAEDIQVRIFIGLGVAFLVLMTVEGLRASFRPVRARPQAAVAPPRKAAPAFQPFRAPPEALRAPVKPVKPPVSRHRPERPKIRRPAPSAKTRKPTFTDEAAPYSPLPPK